MFNCPRIFAPGPGAELNRGAPIHQRNHQNANPRG